MEHKAQLITVTGATGHQGGAVARHLLKNGWRVRALTRDPGKPAARASVQNFWLPNVGVEGEGRQGKASADAARAAGVKHVVYSSVGAAHRGMGRRTLPASTRSNSSTSQN